MNTRRDWLTILVILTILVGVACGLVTAVSGVWLLARAAQIAGSPGLAAESEYARSLGIGFLACGIPFAIFSLSAGALYRTLRAQANRLDKTRA